MVTVETVSIVFTGLSVSLAAFYYISTLRNSNKMRELSLKAQEQALETRQAQLFMQIYNKATSKEGIDSVQLLMEANWSSHEEWLEKYRNNPVYYNALSFYIGYMEGLGVFIKENLVDIKLIALFFAGVTRMMWEQYRDIITEERKRLNYRRYASEWEYTYNELLKYMEEHPELKT
jgi:hypothetical protein